MKMLDKMEEQHLNQSQLAERMGCTQQYISKILRGQENLSIETIAKIELIIKFTDSVFFIFIQLKSRTHTHLSSPISALFSL